MSVEDTPLMTHLTLMSITTCLASKVLTTEATADMILAFDLVAKQLILVVKILIAIAAPVMLLFLMLLHFFVLCKAKGAVFIATWEIAVIFGRFCSSARVHGWWGSSPVFGCFVV